MLGIEPTGRRAVGLGRGSEFQHYGSGDPRYRFCSPGSLLDRESHKTMSASRAPQSRSRRCQSRGGLKRPPIN